MTLDLALLAPSQRSGSTLLQRLFNTNPKNLVWGEHGGTLSYLIDLREQMLTFAEFEGGAARDAVLDLNSRTSSWIANATPEASAVEDAIVDAARAVLGRIYARPTSYSKVGFKEVRYGAREIALLKAAFPQCLIVGIIRDPIETMESIGRQGWPIPSSLFEWSSNAHSLIEATRLDGRSRVFQYSDIANRVPETVGALCELIDCSESALIETMQRQISGPEGFVATPTLDRLSDDVVRQFRRESASVQAALASIGPDGRPR